MGVLPSKRFSCGAKVGGVGKRDLGQVLNDSTGAGVTAAGMSLEAEVKEQTPSIGIANTEVQKVITQGNKDSVVVYKKPSDIVFSTAPKCDGEMDINSNYDGKVIQASCGTYMHEFYKRLERRLPGPLEAKNDLLTETEVQRRISEDKRVMVIINGNVYDLTDFVALHPGGEKVICSRTGAEVAEIFKRIHRRTTIEWSRRFIVGRLRSADMPPIAVTPVTDVMPATVNSARVLSTEVVAVGIRKVTLSSSESLQIVPGGYVTVMLFNELNNGPVAQSSYTPFIWDETSFTIAVKKYPNGVVSCYIDSLKCGDEIGYKGPFPPKWIAEEDEFLHRETAEKKHVLFVAGGVGVTPIYAIVTHLLKRQVASVTMVVSYCVPEVMLLREEIAALADTYGMGRDERIVKEDDKGRTSHGTFQLHYIFTRAEGTLTIMEADKVHFGHFSPEIASCLMPATTCVICGPPAFTGSVMKTLVDTGLYSSKQVCVL